MASATKQGVQNLKLGLVAAGTLGTIGTLLVVMLVATVVAGAYERARIYTRITASAAVAPDDKAEGFAARRIGRYPSQARGSAIIPAVPHDPLRQAHTRMQVAHSLREAASDVLDTHAAIRRARKHDRYLSGLYTSERTKAATSIMRRELAVVGMLALGGVIAVWGLR